MKPFSITINGRPVNFKRGSIIIPLVQRDKTLNISNDDVHEVVRTIAAEDFVNIYAVNTGLADDGPDLGGLHAVLEKPKVALLTGKGTSAYSVGQVWHLLNERMHIPVSLINTDQINRTLLDKYNVLVMTDGYFEPIDSTDIKTIKSWISRGGCIITTSSGSNWAVRNKIVEEQIKDSKMDTLDIAYEKVRTTRGAQQIGGSIFELVLDTTHPIAFGYKKKIPVFRNNEYFFELSVADAANVGRYTDAPLLSGYISDRLLDDIKNTAAIIARKVNGGYAVLFADNPHFRAFWYGTDGLLLNAVFFGRSF